MTKTLYLWLLECRDGSGNSNLGWLFPFYAESQTEAERLVNEQLTLRPHLVFVALHERPEGFRVFHYDGRCCIHGKQGCIQLRGKYACFPDIEEAKTLIKRFQAEG